MISKSIIAAQKCIKNSWQECFAFLNAYYLYTHLIKAVNSFDSSRTCGRLLENPKTGGFRELFPPENNFKKCSVISFPKNIQSVEAWKPAKNMKLRLEFFFSHALLHMNSMRYKN